MTSVHILELTDGNCSLEIGQVPLAELKARIEMLWGTIEIRPHVASQSVRFGGCDFVLQNEWDDPCLISLSTEGAALLRQLAESFSGIPR